MRGGGLTLALAATWLGAAPAGGQVTTVPVYLPGYRASAWSALRGSVVGSNAAETTYTVFCADPSPQKCDIAEDFPFTFAEGTSTLHFEGKRPGILTANLACKLAGTTEAACTGFSSLGKGVTQGRFTGPTEGSWTSTYSGSAVHWGVLTMATPVSTTASLEVTGAVAGTAGPTGAVVTQPSVGIRLDGATAVMWALITMMVTAAAM